MRKSFYEIYVNYFLIPKKPTLLHIHYNTGNSFFLAISRFPEKKILIRQPRVALMTTIVWNMAQFDVYLGV